MTEPEELLTVAEIAAALKMNQQTIRNWIDSGYLPAIRIGRRVRVKRSDFDALLEASYTGRATHRPGCGTARYRHRSRPARMTTLRRHDPTPRTNAPTGHRARRRDVKPADLRQNAPRLVPADRPLRPVDLFG